MSADATSLPVAHERAIRKALQSPRGHYPARRASQLSGVPQRTLYDWRDAGILTSDYARQRPQDWSYRDLVFLRLAAWLRAKRMPRPDVATRISAVRKALDEGGEFTLVRSDGHALFAGDDLEDPATGQVAFRSVLDLVDEFKLVAPSGLPDLKGKRLWGPNLVHPSPRSEISPQVMGGEPCVRNTRIPTATLFALRTDRGLDEIRIQTLYSALRREDVSDAIDLEKRLRHAA